MWISVDYGKKRVGFALSRSQGLAVTPCGVLARPDGPWVKADSFALVIGRIREMAAESGDGLDGIVLGDPGEDDDGSYYLRRTILELRSLLEARFGCPVRLHDERFSSREAAEALAGSGGRGAGPLDDRAAAVILDRFFEEMRKTRPQ